MQNWNEMVTAQLWIGLRSEPKYWVEYVKKSTGEQCPNRQFNMFAETPEDALYEWSVTGCGDIPAQSELARVHLGLDGLHVLHYAIKQSPMPEEKRQLWAQNLQNTQFVKPQA